MSSIEKESQKACRSSAFLSVNPSRNVIKGNSGCGSEFMRHRVLLHTLKIAGSLLNFQHNVLTGNSASGDGGCGGDESLLRSVYF